MRFCTRMKKIVLVIEDDAAIRENTAELLELSDYKVLTAENGRIGFDIVKKDRPDVVICDIMMPVSDGRAFFKLVKEEGSTAGIPLIFFSAGSMPDEVKKGRIKGADEYLRKPFTNKDLLSAVERCLKKNSKN
jgi:CheY-like chemotaxis protein